MDGATANARRKYHHVHNGGKLRESDVAGMVRSMENKDATIARLTAELEAVEKLRPHWAQGWTSDGVAAQVSTAALSQLWELLGTTNQTQAVRAIVELKQAVDAETRACAEEAERTSTCLLNSGHFLSERCRDAILTRIDQRKEAGV